MNSWFPGTLDAFFQALFLCALLLFWLCVYHGIRVQVRSPKGPHLCCAHLSVLCSPVLCSPVLCSPVCALLTCLCSPVCAVLTCAVLTCLCSAHLCCAHLSVLCSPVLCSPVCALLTCAVLTCLCSAHLCCAHLSVLCSPVLCSPVCAHLSVLCSPVLCSPVCALLTCAVLTCLCSAHLCCHLSVLCSPVLSPAGRPEAPGLLPAQAADRGAAVALGRHAGNLANVRNLLRRSAVSAAVLWDSHQIGLVFRVNELQDPTYQYKVDIQNFQVSFLQLHTDRSCLIQLYFKYIICDPGAQNHSYGSVC